MPDKRSHRGPHPEDAELFSDDAIPDLRDAGADLIWLFNRGYANASSMKLVGDRYHLDRRQRLAVGRSVCSDDAVEARAEKQLSAQDVAGKTLWIDGLNLLVTIEAAIGGGVILVGRDGTLRDMSSMHGTFRKTDETVEALELIGQTTQELGTAECWWYYDAPVSNSGRVCVATREAAERNGWEWQAETVNDPDKVLVDTHETIVSADSMVLDRCWSWINLARLVVERHVPDAWILDFTPK